MTYDRRTARAIRLDKSSIGTLAEEIHDALFEKTQGMTGRIDRRLFWTRPQAFALRSVDGRELLVNVHVMSVPDNPRESYIHQAEAGQGNVGDHYINISVNGGVLAEDLHRSLTQGRSSLVYEQLYSALIHELTHVAESEYIPSARAGGGTPEYYNLPHEVRAYMQMIVAELSEVLPRYPLLAKRFGPGRALTMFLNFSPTWGKVEDYWSEANKRKVIKTVAQLIDEGEANPGAIRVASRWANRRFLFGNLDLCATRPKARLTKKDRARTFLS